MIEFWRNFHGPNAGYLLELYERYEQNPNSVDEATRAFFDDWTPPTDGTGPAPTTTNQLSQIAGAVNLAQAIREWTPSSVGTSAGAFAGN